MTDILSRATKDAMTLLMTDWYVWGTVIKILVRVEVASCMRQQII
jgi:hypothetical protein